MKRVVDGKVYDTDTAKLVYEYSRGFSGVARFIYEGLYKTKLGRFFIEYSGGPYSVYGECEGSTVSGSSGIRVVDADEAMKWCERHHCPVEIMASYFTLEEG